MQIRRALTVLTGGIFDGAGNRVYSASNPAPNGRPFSAPSGQYQPPSHQISASAAALTGNTCVFVPIDVGPSSVTYDRIAVSVGTAVAGGTTPALRLGIYADDGTGGGPGTLLLDAGAVTITATGVQFATIAQTLPPGRYWLAAAYTYAAAPTTGLQAFCVSSSVSLAGPTWTNSYRSKVLTGVAAGALPSSGAGAIANLAGSVSVALRAA